MLKYRRKAPGEEGTETHTPMSLELTWTIIPSLICVVLFVWSSSLYVRNGRPPVASTEIFVIGKQWMWHLQHPEGPREINELHVPVGVPVKLTMTSQDVIHDFYIPAFRVKKDVLPGRYSSIWFQPTETGTFHLFCAQYCGTNHSEMIGWVYVMSPTDYATWLAGGEKTESMAQQGGRLFSQFGCGDCHAGDTANRGPSLAGMYGRPEKTSTGETRVMDETMIRQAIYNPGSVRVPGYQAIMPTYAGQIDEEQMLQLIAYVKSLGAEERINGK
jgi:cytochrome c oxidase subunit II